MDDGERFQELADFLRTRRARLTPEDVGLPDRRRRRTPGLRREEAAELADIGVSCIRLWNRLAALAPLRRCCTA